MWYLYLDESGDLGFDFVNKRPSRFFTVSILGTRDRESLLGIRRSVRKTLRRKLNVSKGARIPDLEGTRTALQVKRYFRRHVSELKFGLYAVTLNKRRAYKHLTRDKERAYNYIARRVIDSIGFDHAESRVQLVVDRSKSIAGR